jgi:hypothetical protein
MWWLIGGAAWYALAAVVVRQLPRCDDDDLVEAVMRGWLWLFSPLAAALLPAFALFWAGVWFAGRVLTPRENDR